MRVFALQTSIFFCALLVLFTSCKKFVVVEPGSNLIEAKDVFSNDKTALSAVSGVYTFMRSNFFVFPNGGLSLNGGLASDEIYPTSSSSAALAFYQNQLVSNNTSVSTYFYNHAYKVIYHANTIMEGMAASLLADTLKNQIRGEMLTIRSMMFFYLVNLFGDVPLITHTHFEENAKKGRAISTEVYSQIIADLTEAKGLLSERYPSTGKGRINLWTATSLLARVYLYQKDWEKAEQQASLVISSGGYSLIPSTNLSNVFTKNSAETIWEMPGANEFNVTGEGSFFIPGSTSVRPTYALTPFLVGRFETGDCRKNSWLGKNTVSGIEYWYPLKYKQNNVSGNGNLNEYQIIFRLAELYLIRAESRAQQGNLSGAMEDANMLRKRAGISELVSDNQHDILTIIEKENQIEFFAEWGHRWLDLKRTGKADIVLGPIKGGNWQSTDVLWPIPLTELTYNPNLDQNPGY